MHACTHARTCWQLLRLHRVLCQVGRVLLVYLWLSPEVHVEGLSSQGSAVGSSKM